MSAMNNVLDTLRLDIEGFYLKDLHIARTQKALRLIGSNVYTEEITKIYDQIESQLLTVSSFSPQIIRLVINQNLKYF